MGRVAEEVLMKLKAGRVDRVVLTSYKNTNININRVAEEVLMKSKAGRVDRVVLISIIISSSVFIAASFVHPGVPISAVGLAARAFWSGGAIFKGGVARKPPVPWGSSSDADASGTRRRKMILAVAAEAEGVWVPPQPMQHEQSCALVSPYQCCSCRPLPLRYNTCVPSSVLELPTPPAPIQYLCPLISAVVADPSRSHTILLAQPRFPSSDALRLTQ